MKTYQELLETTEALPNKADIEQMIITAWNVEFHDTYYSAGTAMSSDDYTIIKFALGKNTSEWANGIFENDPLNLMMSVSIKSDYIEIQYKRCSLTIKPDNEYMAFSSKKFKLRKQKLKSIKKIEKKLKTDFKKIKTIIKDCLKNGDLDIHGEKIVKMIKGKLK